MEIISAIFAIIILILSVMFHELAHGTVADRLGDPTPGLAGRLTLNPIAHLDLVGSFIIPLVCVITGSGFILGWAKPVPFNISYLKYKRWGPAMVAAAGPIANILIALIAAAAFRLASGSNETGTLLGILSIIVSINVTLAVFNLIPVPPLDGHHIVGALIPKYRRWADNAMRGYGFILLVIVLFVGSSLIAPVVSFITYHLLGL